MKHAILCHVICSKPLNASHCPSTLCPVHYRCTPENHRFINYKYDRKSKLSAEFQGPMPPLDRPLVSRNPKYQSSKAHQTSWKMAGLMRPKQSSTYVRTAQRMPYPNATKLLLRHSAAYISTFSPSKGINFQRDQGGTYFHCGGEKYSDGS